MTLFHEDKAPKMEARKEDWITAVLPENAPDFCKAGSSQERGQNWHLRVLNARQREKPAGSKKDLRIYYSFERIKPGLILACEKRPHYEKF